MLVKIEGPGQAGPFPGQGLRAGGSPASVHGLSRDLTRATGRDQRDSEGSAAGGRSSGLIEAQSILRNIEGISFCHFTDRDVVRHPLVQKIVVAYEARDKARGT